MWSYSVLGFLAVLAVANGFPSHHALEKSLDGRIVGGSAVSIEDVPYQVSLSKSDGVMVCGASILSANYVLTAGHCTSLLEDGFVRAGSSSTKAGGSVHQIVDIKQHEDYQEFPRGLINDIAILRVEPPFVFDATRAPVKLYEGVENDSNDAFVGELATVTGFGAWSDYEDGDESLLAVSVPMVNRDSCNQSYKMINFEPIMEDRICAGRKEGGKDSCQGDSGGPLVINGRQAAIVSYGYRCAQPGIPGVYTNVAHFADWIARNTL